MVVAERGRSEGSVRRGLRALLPLAIAIACAPGCLRAPPPVSPPVVVVVAPAAGAPLATFDPGAAPPERHADDTRAAGDLIEVEWHGSWWPAVVVERRGPLWLIHYENYAEEWNEAVPGDRIRARTATVEGEEPEDESDP